ncbi:MAG TPA: hypothetical protein PLH19_06185 [Anaerolineae bacterium]|nr:hypothetical protein [Anaerolineae bacterium]HQH38109.1 hypothetical protein [Anaerolineae bacterium]
MQRGGLKEAVPECVLKLPYPFERYHVYQGRTNDCGAYCIAMVSNGLYDIPLVNAAALASELDRRGLPDRVPGWALFPWGVVATFRRLGLHARWRRGARLTQLFGLLRRNLTTLVIVGEPLRFVNHKWSGWSHYKILYAWEPEREFGFVDPATPQRAGVTWQKVEEFRRQWTWMGRQIIEVEGPGDAGILSAMRE